jgi:hypothetical protein
MIKTNFEPAIKEPTCVEAVTNALLAAEITPSDEDISTATRWCESAASPESIASDLSSGKWWSVVAAVSAKLGRPLSRVELEQVIALSANGYDVESIISRFEEPAPPAPAG